MYDPYCVNMPACLLCASRFESCVDMGRFLSSGVWNYGFQVGWLSSLDCLPLLGPTIHNNNIIFILGGSYVQQWMIAVSKFTFIPVPFSVLRNELKIAGYNTNIIRRYPASYTCCIPLMTHLVV